MKCPVCRSTMKWYENPGRWLCTNVKLHDAVAARGKYGGVARATNLGHHSKRKKKT